MIYTRSIERGRYKDMETAVLLKHGEPMMYILDVNYSDGWRWTDVRDRELPARPMFTCRQGVIDYLNNVAKIIYENALS